MYIDKIYTRLYSDKDWSGLTELCNEIHRLSKAARDVDKVLLFSAVSDLEDEIDNQSNDLEALKEKIKKLESELKSKKLSKAAKNGIKKTLDTLKKILIGGAIVAGGLVIGGGLGLPSGYAKYNGNLELSDIFKDDKSGYIRINGTEGGNWRKVDKTYSELTEEVGDREFQLKMAKAKLKDLKEELRKLDDDDPKDEDKRSAIWKHIRRLAALIGSGALAYGVVSSTTDDNVTVKRPIGGDVTFDSVNIGEALMDEDLRNDMSKYGLPILKMK